MYFDRISPIMTILCLTLPCGCGNSSTNSANAAANNISQTTDATQSDSGAKGADASSSAGSDTDGEQPEGEIPKTLPKVIDSADFISWFVKALCATSTRCGLKHQGEIYSDTTSCELFETNHWRQHWERYTELLSDESAGVGWDGKAARTCIEDLFSRACKRTVSIRHWPTSPCAEAFIGAVEGDQSCIHDAQCKAGFCDKSGSKQGCPGKCRAWKAIGEVCGVGARCGSGGWCRVGKCVPAPGGGGMTGDACGMWPCAKGHFCTGSGEEPGKCLLFPTLGDECQEKVGCAAGLRCDAGKCVNGLAKDAPCSTNGTLEGHIETCGAGLICTPTLADYNRGEWTKGKCMPSQGAKDQWCDGVFQCGRVDLFCKDDKDGGYCATLPGPGEACASAANKPECRPGLICPGGQGCKAPSALGQKCDINQNFCASPLICNLGKCVKFPKIGQACLKDPKIQPCGEGATCVGKTCKASCG